jgi:hypothetical protein
MHHDHHAKRTARHGDATLALLWERIRRRATCPASPSAINAILARCAARTSANSIMTQTVLSDPVLTQKVLRLANSGMYSAFGQRINTVSKAVLVLGTEAIGHLALGLKLIEELAKSSPDSVHRPHRDGKGGAGRDGGAAGRLQRRHARPEEAVVCSMLHSLGRMMVTFYMPERWAACRRTAAPAAKTAPRRRCWACRWNADRPRHRRALGPAAQPDRRHAPHRAGRTRRRLQPRRLAGRAGRPCRRSAPTRCGTTTSRRRGGARAGQQLSPMLGVEPDNIMLAIEKAKVEAAADLSIAPLAKPAEKRAKALASTRMREPSNKVLMSGRGRHARRRATASPGQMMSMALETVYQGLSFTRAFGFLRNRREKSTSPRWASATASRP